MTGWRVSVVFGRRDDHGHRDLLWSWVHARWAGLLPGYEIVTGDTDDDHFRFGPATNRARAKATGEIIIGTEADTVFDPDWVRAAVAHVEAHPDAWVLPTVYHQLTEAHTARLLGGLPTVAVLAGPVDWSGLSWAGLLVASRAAWDLVGGYDERIDAWGPVDVCLSYALRTLVGPVTRLDGAAYHLWHPVVMEDTWWSESFQAAHEIREEYEAAFGDPAAMRTVVARGQSAEDCAH